MLCDNDCGIALINMSRSSLCCYNQVHEVATHLRLRAADELHIVPTLADEDDASGAHKIRVVLQREQYRAALEVSATCSASKWRWFPVPTSLLGVALLMPHTASIVSHVVCCW